VWILACRGVSLPHLGSESLGRRRIYGKQTRRILEVSLWRFVCFLCHPVPSSHRFQPWLGEEEVGRPQLQGHWAPANLTCTQGLFWCQLGGPHLWTERNSGPALKRRSSGAGWGRGRQAEAHVTGFYPSDSILGHRII
jgi:hypothetical protein